MTDVTVGNFPYDRLDFQNETGWESFKRWFWGLNWQSKLTFASLIIVALAGPILLVASIVLYFTGSEYVALVWGLGGVWVIFGPVYILTCLGN